MTVTLQVNSSGIGPALKLLEDQRASTADATAAKVAAEAAQEGAETAQAAAEAAAAAAAATNADRADRTLSNLSSATSARTNLGLGDAAVKNVGTVSGTVAAGDDSRITGAAQKSSNLSDLASASTARSNLSLPTLIKTNTTSGNMLYGSSGASLSDTAAGTKNGDINTSFGVGAFQSGTTTYACAAFGYGALNATTTGHSNTALGYQAGLGVTTGIMNTLVGVDAAYQSTALNYCTVIGHHCLNTGNFSGQGAVIIGQQTARSLTEGDYIIAIGRNAMANSPATGSTLSEVIGGASAIGSTVVRSTVVGGDIVTNTGATITDSVLSGYRNHYAATSVTNTLSFGTFGFFRSSATGVTSDNNTGVGAEHGYNVAGDNNVFIGYRSGYRTSSTTINGAVCIGHLSGFNAVTSEDLYIGNSDALTAHLFWGNFGTQVLNVRANSLTFVDMPTYSDDAAAAAASFAAGKTFYDDNGFLRRVRSSTSANYTFGGLVRFSGTTSSFPALKRSSTVLEVRLADDSGYAPLAASYLRTIPVAVAALPAAATAGAGARAFVTDANATTFASIVAGGGANGVPVYSDGTDWRIG